MKLTKKHLNQLFDCIGGDGSWYYQLVAVRKGKLLFNVNGEPRRFDISSDSYNDWRRITNVRMFSKSEIKWGWKNGRRDK